MYLFQVCYPSLWLLARLSTLLCDGNLSLHEMVVLRGIILCRRGRDTPYLIVSYRLAKTR